MDSSMPNDNGQYSVVSENRKHARQTSPVSVSNKQRTTAPDDRHTTSDDRHTTKLLRYPTLFVNLACGGLGLLNHQDISAT